MQKEEARKKFLSLRKQFSKNQVDKLSLDLLENLKKIPIWDKNFYHIFLPIVQKKEINTYPILDYLWAQNKKVCIPKLDFSEKHMDCVLFDKKTLLKLNKYKIYEPIKAQKIDPYFLEICFVPLLAFDLSGHRVGYGKGFYDYFFKNCKKNLIKIGLSFFDPINKIDNLHKDDIPLDRCITPYNSYIF